MTLDLEPHRVLERSGTVPRYTQPGRRLRTSPDTGRPSCRTGSGNAPRRSDPNRSRRRPVRLGSHVRGRCNASAATSVAPNVGWSIARLSARGASPLMGGERSPCAVEVGQGAVGDHPPTSLGFATPGESRAERPTSLLGSRRLAPAAASGPAFRACLKDLTWAAGSGSHPLSRSRPTRYVTWRAERAIGGPGRTTTG